MIPVMLRNFAEIVVIGFLIVLQIQQTMADCPLDLSESNFTLAAPICSDHQDRAMCCRYINAFVLVSMAHHANRTGELSVSSSLSEICLSSVSESLQVHGISHNATTVCGLGTRIPLTYQCMGRHTVGEMLQTWKFNEVAKSCSGQISYEVGCRSCLNSVIAYLRHLIGTGDNITLSICRDATFVTLASQVNKSAISLASCFFGAQGLSVQRGMAPSATPSSPRLSTKSPAIHPVSSSGTAQFIGKPTGEHHHRNHILLIVSVGIPIIIASIVLLSILVYIIHVKSRELKSINISSKPITKAFSSWPMQGLEEGTLVFQKFSYNKAMKATSNFRTIIGRGEFGTVYKAQFNNGFTAALKSMNQSIEWKDINFARELEPLFRLRHRHIVAIRGFCADRRGRLLMYQYMENGSLKDHLHSHDRTPLSWERRFQVAIDVAYALEYLHFYCETPLVHGSLKSSNVLFDEDFTAKVADFGLARIQRRGIGEITAKKDMYDYGILLIEIVSAKSHEELNQNLLEWAENIMMAESRLAELIDPSIVSSYDMGELATLVNIIKRCTQRNETERLSIKQVLRLLH